MTGKPSDIIESEPYSGASTLSTEDDGCVYAAELPGVDDNNNNVTSQRPSTPPQQQRLFAATTIITEVDPCKSTSAKTHIKY